MRRKCRIWWPIELSVTEPTSSTFLFGWFTSSSLSSLDIIVAFACDEVSFSPNQSGLLGILHETNGSLSASLQDKCTFSFLGHCALNLSSNGQLMAIGLDEDDQINTIHSNASTGSFHNMLMEKNTKWSCGCQKIDGSLDHSSMVSGEENNWVQLVYGSHGYTGRKIKWIPKLHHMHWHGQTVSCFDLHVILYDAPMFGSPNFISFFSHFKSKQFQESVVMVVNNANAAKLCFERLVGSESSTVWFSTVCLCITLTWQLLAMFIASLSTLFYIIFQFLHVLLSSGSQSWMYLTLGKVFSNTIKNIQFHCSQILYWPILLEDNVLRSQSCVEFAEKAALHKHSMWSSVATEILMGYAFGIALFFHAESVCLWASNSANNITNYLLRNGCVWLMGVPAGFKLNTELARVLGMLSLNAIQIWSTLWFFVGSVFIYFVKGLAILGVLFGVTTPAALIVDMILLATLHVSTLHWLISHLYSYQIQAIAAFSRLFRGQKWNPLRERYDSYDYTVEQHIVGSLLFTPLLLLLPTTSVFYIFFTILKSTISFTCLSIDIVISIIRATPYIKILFWLVRPRRFPSGIWFEIISCQSNGVEPLDIDRLSDTCTPSEKSWQTTDTSGTRPSVLVSILQSNFLNIGQIVWPHYREVFSVVSGSFVASSAYGVLTGRRIPPSTLGTGLPSMMPLTFIPYKEYWRICYNSVFACKADAHRDSFQ